MALRLPFELDGAVYLLFIAHAAWFSGMELIGVDSPSGHPMCKRHDQLRIIYRRAVRTFGISLDALQAAIAISPQDSQGVQEYVEEARAVSEQARINLEKHIGEHGCQDE
jgi:hypothetical protein